MPAAAALLRTGSLRVWPRAKSNVPPFCLFPPINLKPLPCSIFCLTLSSTFGGTFLASEGAGLNGPQELKKNSIEISFKDSTMDYDIIMKKSKELLDLNKKIDDKITRWMELEEKMG